VNKILLEPVSWRISFDSLDALFAGAFCEFLHQDADQSLVEIPANVAFTQWRPSNVSEHRRYALNNYRPLCSPVQRHFYEIYHDEVKLASSRVASLGAIHESRKPALR